MLLLPVIRDLLAQKLNGNTIALIASMPKGNITRRLTDTARAYAIACLGRSVKDPTSNFGPDSSSASSPLKR